MVAPSWWKHQAFVACIPETLCSARKNRISPQILLMCLNILQFSAQKQEHFLSQSKEDSEYCWGWKMFIFSNYFFVWTQMCASTCWESNCTNCFYLELTGLVRKRNPQTLVISLLFMSYFIYSLSFWDLGGVEEETFNFVFWSVWSF